MTDNLHLNIDTIDEKHDAFLAILDKLLTSDDSAFLPLFEEMVEHTREHFEFEENMMHTYNFYGKEEHIGEHRSLLGEMTYFYTKSKRFPAFGRSYINDYAFEKFKRHILNIDSQLAMFLKENKLV
jgi:hemerythrin-like metal-binding protein